MPGEGVFAGAGGEENKGQALANGAELGGGSSAEAAPKPGAAQAGGDAGLGPSGDGDGDKGLAGEAEPGGGFSARARLAAGSVPGGALASWISGGLTPPRTKGNKDEGQNTGLTGGVPGGSQSMDASSSTKRKDEASSVLSPIAKAKSAAPQQQSPSLVADRAALETFDVN